MPLYDNLSLEEARRRMHFDPETGVFTWLESSRFTKIRGRQSKSLDVSGYVQIHFKPYSVIKGHRLAWFMHYGEWPNGHIDHINGDRADNRIANLRVVTNALNCQNKRNPLPSNKTGFLGVSPRRDKFLATITLHRKTHHLGAFNTPEEAHDAYLKAKRRMHQACAI